MISFNGMQIYSNPLMVVTRQNRFPRSKSKRIRKKWMKDARNWITEPSRSIIRTQFGIVCHPIIEREIKKAIAEGRSNHDRTF